MLYFFIVVCDLLKFRHQLGAGVAFFSPTFAGLNLVVYYAGWAFIDREGTDGREK